MNKGKPSPLQRLVSQLGFAIAVASIVISLLLGVPSCQPQLFDGMRFPLGQIDGIEAYDDELFVASSTYSAMHVYDHDGNWLRSFNVDARPFRFTVHEGQVFTWSSGWQFVYSPEGVLLSSDTGVEEPPSESVAHSVAFTDDGTRLQIERVAGIHPVLRRGEREIISLQPVLFTFLQVPFPAFLYGTLGFLYVIVIVALRERRQRRADGEAVRNGAG